MNRLRIAGIVFLAVAAVGYLYADGTMRTFPVVFFVVGLALIVKSRKRESAQ